MALQLILPNISHKEQYFDMMDEWLKHGGRLHPAALQSNGASYEMWLLWMKDDQSYKLCPDLQLLK